MRSLSLLLPLLVVAVSACHSEKKAVVEAPPAAPLTPTQPAESATSTMNTPTLSNPVVKAALDAFQAGDKKTWSSLFEPGAAFFDDGNPRDLNAFSNDALGHERFTAIEEVSADGRQVAGPFHSDKWGNFRVYFKFQLSTAGKIQRLDIGQSK